MAYQPPNMNAQRSHEGLALPNQYQLQEYARVDFRADDFEQVLHQHGARIIWEKSILCNCIDIDPRNNAGTGQPDYDCQYCNGRGFRFFDPTDIRGALSSVGKQDDMVAMGLLDIGTAFLTTRAKDKVGFHDRLTFIDFTTHYSQIIKVRNNKARLKYDVVKVLHVLMDDTVFKEGEDFELNDERTHIIFTDDLLQDDEQLSILLEVRPTYIVTDVTKELRGQFINFHHAEETWYLLPRQVQMKREDLMPLKRGDL